MRTSVPGIYPRVLWRTGGAFLLTAVLVACGGGGGDPSAEELTGDAPVDDSGGGTGGGSGGSDGDGDGAATPMTMALTGSVGDGPIVGATITVTDADGMLLATTSSAADASYMLPIPVDATFPLSVTASGGIDSVTARPPRMRLLSAVVSAEQTVANVSPVSTLLLGVANCIGGDLAAALPVAIMNSAQALPALLDVSGLPNPIATAVTDDVGQDVVLTNEALGEVVRRASVALGNVNPDADELADVLNVLACDLSDGLLDADGPGLADLQRRVAAINVALAEVATELLRGDLRVGGIDATIALDAAVSRFFPAAPAGSVVDRRADAEVIAVGRQAVQTALELSPSAELISISRGLEVLEGGEPLTEVRDVLMEDEDSTLFSGAKARVASLPDTSPVFAAATRVGTELATAVAAATFAAADGVVALDLNASTSLLVSAPGMVACRVSSDVPGDEDDFLAAMLIDDMPVVTGTVATEPLNQAVQNYRLECVGNNRSSDLELAITPNPPEVLSFTASAAQVDLGGTVAVSWTTRNVVGCVPVGDFEGVDSIVPSATGVALPSVGSIDDALDFTLNCSGLAAEASASLRVPTNPPVITRFKAFDPIVAGEEVGLLSWATSNASDCTGSEDAGPDTGFAGVRPTAFGDGTDPDSFFGVGTIDRGRTFTLTCSGAIGLPPAVAEVTVETQGALLSWRAPTQLSNGAELTLSHIAFYRVYVTEDPEGPYDDAPIVVAADGAELSAAIALEPGTYFFAVTAVLTDGSESAFSAEVSKVVLAAE